MITKIVDAICKRIVDEELASEDDFDVLVYGMRQLLCDTLQIVILLVGSTLLKATPYTTMLTVFYALLRRNIGGAHASTHIRCVLYFTFLALIGGQTAKYLAQTLSLAQSSALICCLCVAAVLLVWRKAPVMHPNCPKSPKTIAKFKQKSRKVVLLQVLCILLMLCMPAYGLSATIGCLTAALTLCAPIPISKERSVD